MKQVQALHLGPLLISLLAAAFCLWSALGNDIDFCVTTGCSLYQDFSILGISMWWLGTFAFASNALLALTGAANWGKLFSGLTLSCDILLLILLFFTAPCLSCLIVAVFFALVHIAFCNQVNKQERVPNKSIFSPLILIWSAFFIINIAFAMRSQLDTWALNEPGLDEAGYTLTATRVFFSPTCPFCQKAVDALSGKIDVAFYPITESDEDLGYILAMKKYLDDGENMSDALKMALESPVAVSNWNPEVLFMRLHLLRNKAHVLLAGSRTIPFIEYHGLPTFLQEIETEQKESDKAKAKNKTSETDANWDTSRATPQFLEPSVIGQCGENMNCR